LITEGGKCKFVLREKGDFKATPLHIFSIIKMTGLRPFGFSVVFWLPRLQGYAPQWIRIVF
jgi:hypothetical protein